MPETSPQQHHLLRHWLISAAVFVVFFALYAATAQRGVSWQDSGEFQYRVLAGDYVWQSGIARAHPLYIGMARGFVRLFPQPACFYAINLFSGVGLALGLAFLSASVLALTRSARAAVLSAVVLGFAHMAWWLGTVAEVYTWSLAFLMAEVFCLIRYFERRTVVWMFALFTVNGAQWSVHNFALIDLAVISVMLGREWWISGRQRGWLALGCFVGWSFGSLPLLWLAVASLMNGESVMAVLGSVLFGEGYMAQVLGTGGCGGALWLANLTLAAVSLLNPLWLFAMAGVRRGHGGKQSETLLWLKILTFVHLLFWVRYRVPDQATFLLPTLGLLAVWAGLGAARVLRERRGWFAASVALSLACSVLAPHVTCRAAERLLPPRSRVLPFRDEFAYWAYPWKHNEDSAERFVEAVARERYPEGMVVWADTTAVAPLMAAQAMGRLPASWRWLSFWQNEADEAILRQMRASPDGGYVVSPVRCYVPEAILDRAASFERRGVLHRIVW